MQEDGAKILYIYRVAKWRALFKHYLYHSEYIR